MRNASPATSRTANSQWHLIARGATTNHEGTRRAPRTRHAATPNTEPLPYLRGWRRCGGRGSAWLGDDVRKQVGRTGCRGAHRGDDRDVNGENGAFEVR